MFKKLFSTPWPSILWSIVIFILLTISSPSIASESSFKFPNFDKLVHALLFGLFVTLWWFYLSTKWDNWFLALILGLISTVYGIGMEYYQLYFTKREFEFADMLADGIGSALAVIYCVWSKKSPYGNRGRNQN